MFLKGSSTGGTTPEETHTGSSPEAWPGSSELPEVSSEGGTSTSGTVISTTGVSTQGAVSTSVSTTTGSTSTTQVATEPPELPPELPPPQPPRQPPRPPSKEKPPTSLAAQNITVVIGVIAGSMIAVILLILIVLRFKSRSTAAYKLDDSKHSQQGPSAALLPPPVPEPLAPALRNSNNNGRVRKQKDVKEWYV